MNHELLYLMYGDRWRYTANQPPNHITRCPYVFAVPRTPAAAPSALGCGGVGSARKVLCEVAAEYAAKEDEVQVSCEFHLTLATLAEIWSSILFLTLI